MQYFKILFIWDLEVKYIELLMVYIVLGNRMLFLFVKIKFSVFFLVIK